MTYFPRWPLTRSAVVLPDERLPWGATIPMGIQHLVAMSGSTILAPLLMGFDPNLAILFSGIGTLIFFLCTGGRLPSYLGSSFAFIAVVDMSALAGIIGAGGLGNLALQYGFRQFNPWITWGTVLVMIIIVQLAQALGNALARKMLRR